MSGRNEKRKQKKENRKKIKNQAKLKKLSKIKKINQKIKKTLMKLRFHATVSCKSQSDFYSKIRYIYKNQKIKKQLVFYYSALIINLESVSYTNH
ncbi:MAG: hypothetical protein PHI15_08195 [Methanomicrobium sp.]|nr:hypothetical protein [Methanomicrobium sp.]